MIGTVEEQSNKPLIVILSYLYHVDYTVGSVQARVIISIIEGRRWVYPWPMSVGIGLWPLIICSAGSYTQEAMIDDEKLDVSIENISVIFVIFISDSFLCSLMSEM